MGKHRQRNTIQIVLPDRRTETKIENTKSLEFTAIAPGHGNTKSYFHKFKLTDNPMFQCEKRGQS